MSPKAIQTGGIIWTLLCAALVAWLYAVAPRSLSEARTGASVVVGAYEVDPARFAAALALFRREQYAAARDEWARADPARRDARTQFYVAYAFYREGWGRLYNDDTLFRQGLATVERALELSGQATLGVDDADLRIKNAAELKAELQQGLQTTADDFNPLKVTRERK